MGTDARGSTAIAARSSEEAAAPLRSRPPMSRRRVVTVLVAQLTISIALITPTSYSLAIWLQHSDAASRDLLLAAAIGGASLAALLVGPLIAAASDRTTLGLGPRRSWLLAGLAAGTLGSVLMIAIDAPVALVVGWCVAGVGYGSANTMVMVHLSDQLPGNQRGRVLGASSAVVYLGPVVGVMLAGSVASVPSLMFLLPAVGALVGGGLLAATMTDPRIAPSESRLRIADVLSGYWVHPKRHPAYAWVWINRAVFFLAVAFMTLYSVYFLGANVELDDVQIAATMSLGGLIGVAMSTIGAMVFGALSDRARSRLPYLFASTLLLTGGLIVVATSTTVPQYLVGQGVNALALGVYSAVGQALQFDVIPAQENRNGRYIAVLALSNQIPQAAGPFLAAAVLAGLGGEYAAMYIVAAALALTSALALGPLHRHLRGVARTAHRSAIPDSSPEETS